MATCSAKRVCCCGNRGGAGFRIRQFLALAGVSTVDLTRQPVLLLLAITSVAFTALASAQAFQFGEDGRIARDSGLAVHLVFGLMIGVYGACITLRGEMETGTAAAVLSKPVSRDLFFAAKFAALTLLVLLYSACASAACLLGEKASPKMYIPDYVPLAILAGALVASLVLGAVANYRFGRSFVSTAFWLLLVFLVAGTVLAAALPSSGDRYAHGRLFHVATGMQWRILPASMLVTIALAALSGVALALAARLRTIPVLAITTGVLFLGLLSEYLFEGAAAEYAAAALARRILPNWQYFWTADALAGGGSIPWAYVANASFYGIFYLAASLAAGILLFRHREMR